MNVGSVSSSQRFYQCLQFAHRNFECGSQGGDVQTGFFSGFFQYGSPADSSDDAVEGNVIQLDLMWIDCCSQWIHSFKAPARKKPNSFDLGKRRLS